ncbi:MAG: hypothetical protein VYC62_07140, partial [Verrucomicrobiota bacterium]|nr:hypothetical protein [Verrucomicrobiota bacterium]
VCRLWGDSKRPPYAFVNHIFCIYYPSLDGNGAKTIFGSHHCKPIFVKYTAFSKSYKVFSGNNFAALSGSS